ncbi:MAG: circularly permuted type 2 ATP-grasp protein [Granulosicoccus sp.]
MTTKTAGQREQSSRSATLQHDETRDMQGNLAPNWKMINNRLNQLTKTQIVSRQAEIARQLRANGIAYNPTPDETHSSRPWALDLAPFVIEPADWQKLQEALQQRARLKRALLRNIYSTQSLIRDGLLPAAMIYAHKGYLRDAVHSEQSIDLPLFSADVCRSPSGDWYIVDDICQYPAGVGYALENRLVLSRTIPNLFSQARVLRIAQYFRLLQEHIVDLTDSDDRCVILAHGPGHPHYFEFAFLAKYLGYTLVQTDDLTVRDNRVFLKTVAGLRSVSVIFRLIDDTELDPLAVGQSHARGVTGLFQAARTGGVKILNPLGAGVLDNPALNSCLEPLCKHLLGESLLIKGPPTYWLGNADQRNHVMANKDDLLFRNIDSIGRLFDPRFMSDEKVTELTQQIELTPQKYVAQERLDRSVAPTYDGLRRVNQQITVRTFLVEQSGNYTAMAGGLCLLDTSTGGSRPSFDALLGSKDTWVIAQAPVKPDSLISSRGNDAQFSVIEGELPSRVAENLFWMGRNAERSENSIRMLRSVFQTLQNDEIVTLAEYENSPVAPALSAILRATSNATGALPGFVGRGGSRRLQRPQKELLSLLHNRERAGSLPYHLSQLQSSAASVRDRVSDELLKVLNDLDDICTSLVDNVSPQLFTEDVDMLKQISNELDSALASLSAFAGLSQENFTHGDSWHFMMLGRRLERVRHTSVVVNTMLSRDRDDTLLLETLLKLFDSVMTYRSRYRSQIDASLVLKLLLTDELNPRSIAFLFKDIQGHIARLPGRRALTQADALAKLTITGLSRVQLCEPRDLLEASKDARQTLPRLLSVIGRLPEQLADQLSATYFLHVEAGQQLSELHPDN